MTTRLTRFRTDTVTRHHLTGDGRTAAALRRDYTSPTVVAQLFVREVKPLNGLVR